MIPPLPVELASQSRTLRIRTAETAADLEGWAVRVAEAFAVAAPGQATEYAQGYPTGDVLVAVDKAGAVVGGLGLCPAAQRWGGRDVPFAGGAAVCTAAEARGGGVASGLMRAALGVMRARGHAVSALYPASVPLYRRAGYELVGAVTRLRVRMPELAAGVAAPRAGVVVRPLALDALDLTAVDRRAPAGNIVRREAFFQQRLARPKDPPAAYGAFLGDALVGALVVHRTPVERGRHDLDLRLVWAVDAAAMRDLVAFLRHQGSVARYATWTGAPTDALVMALPAEVWEVERVQPWMLRVVDLRAAVAARGFPDGLTGVAELVVEDPLCPWNEGAWRLRVADGRGVVERVPTVQPDAARLDARGLARLFAGHAADERAFAGPCGAWFAGPTPWLQEGF